MFCVTLTLALKWTIITAIQCFYRFPFTETWLLRNLALWIEQLSFTDALRDDAAPRGTLFLRA